MPGLVARSMANPDTQGLVRGDGRERARGRGVPAHVLDGVAVALELDVPPAANAVLDVVNPRRVIHRTARELATGHVPRHAANRFPVAHDLASERVGERRVRRGDHRAAREAARREGATVARGLMMKRGST